MRKGVEVRLGPGDRERLEAIVGSGNSPQKHVWRARIVLLSAEGIGTMAIQRRTGKGNPTIRTMRGGDDSAAASSAMGLAARAHTAAWLSPALAIEGGAAGFSRAKSGSALAGPGSPSAISVPGRGRAAADRPPATDGADTGGVTRASTAFGSGGGNGIALPIVSRSACASASASAAV